MSAAAEIQSKLWKLNTKEKYQRGAQDAGSGSQGIFDGIYMITDKLKVLEEVGLGYLELGQSATTLSGRKRRG